jgi:photosystem II stability/assembly factor-like uncharacterized protein
MLKHFKSIIAFGMIVFMVSCHKGDITLLTHQVPTHTVYDLNSIFFVNDSLGYICGGSRYNIGVIVKTTDGGKTWSAADSVLPNALYTMTFFSAQEALLGGFYSTLMYTNDSAKTFSTSNLNRDIPISHLSFRNRQQGVAACGLGYRAGAVFNTINGGANWTLSYLDSLHALMGSYYVDDSTVVVCGYGTVLRSVDKGVTYHVVRENGDFYQDVDFVNSTGYAVGYQGEVLKSTDKGATWYSVRSSNGLFGSPDHLMGVDFIDENNGYAVGESGLMIHTGNGGGDWQTVNPFTSERLKAVHMFSATSGIVVGAGGRAYLFQQ